MGIKVGIRSPRELHLLKMLGRGAREWDDLNEREKWIVFNSRIDITTAVDESKLREYERELALDGVFGRTERAKALTREFADSLRERMMLP